MTDKKISQLTGATTPLAGTEEVPLVQSSTTKKATVDNLTKGRVVNALTFDTDVAAAGVTLTGTTLAADGTDADIDINITSKGTGALLVDSAAVFNDSGADVDFRVESVSNANMFVVDAGVNKVGIGTNTFNTNGGVLQVSNGISFPATQSTCSDANTLDDYEEGSWEPAITSEGGDFGSVTYNADTGGYYIKIGRLVYLTGTVRWTALTNGSASGGVLIKDLPFTNANRSNGDNADAPGTIQTSVWGGTASVTPTTIWMNRNAANCFIVSQGTGAVRTIVQTTDLGSTASLQFAIVVYTAS